MLFTFWYVYMIKFEYVCASMQIEIWYLEKLYIYNIQLHV